jgi:hypothetical protein
MYDACASEALVVTSYDVSDAAIKALGAIGNTTPMRPAMSRVISNHTLARVTQPLRLQIKKRPTTIQYVCP